MGIIENCFVAGFNAIDASADTFCTRISNCILLPSVPAGTAGAVGIYAAQVGIYQSSIVGFDVGLQACNIGLIVQGNRFEVNNTGIIIGRDRTSSTSGLAGFSIAGNSFERNNTGIYVVACGGGIIAGNAITGTVDVSGAATPLFGMRFSYASGVEISGNTISCRASVAGIDISNVSGAAIDFSGNTVNPLSGWKMPVANHAAFSFRNNNNQPAFTLTFAQLPANPVEGMEFDIIDSNTATWGATPAGGGSNHVRVRHNGTRWTVLGC